MDFGLAKMVEEVRKGATMISGTPYYMAPEQALGENVDHRADLYALGVTFWNLLTNAFPFESGDVTFHHRNTPAPDVRTRAPESPRGDGGAGREAHGQAPRGALPERGRGRAGAEADRRASRLSGAGARAGSKSARRARIRRAQPAR